MHEIRMKDVLLIAKKALGKEAFVFEGKYNIFTRNADWAKIWRFRK